MLRGRNVGVSQIFCSPHSLFLSVTISLAPGRRRFLQAITGLTFGLGMTPNASAQEYEPSVTFNDQSSSGDEVTVAEIVTNDPVKWKVHADKTDYAQGYFEGKQRLENKTIKLGNDIKTSKQVYFSIYPEGGGTALAYDGALITVENDSILGINEIEKNPDAGFNYPYFLYVPSTPGEWSESTPLLVEPNNSPDSSDDFSYHKQMARKAVEGQTARQISDELGVPLLVPIFPRPRWEPVDWRHLTHSLDPQTLKISSGPLERIDKQLLNMIDDAQERLASESHPVQDEIIMDGFSSSGDFVDRFTILYPERILSITAGGVNGMVVLPRKEAKGHTLDYPVGIANIEELTGISVDIEAIDTVNQFYYMGAEDTNDTIGYDDAWTDDELEQIAIDVYGKEMVEDRFSYCEKVFKEEGIDATFKVYEEAGHTPRPALADIIEFHRQAIHPKNAETGTSTNLTPTTASPTNGPNTSSTSASKAATPQSDPETKTTSASAGKTTNTTVPGFGIGAVLSSLVGMGIGHLLHDHLFPDNSSNSSE